MKRTGNVAYWSVPSLICVALYWLGLKAWFQHDDFAWLSLNLRLRETGGLMGVLFEPMAQGTIRPLSERAFFLAFHGLFGLNALPFRIAVFLTQFANLVLISSITRRLTGSRAAGFLAPILWICNGVLATVMSWTAAYNQVLCAFFMLAGFWFLLKHVETGMTRYLALEWTAFLLGLATLEIMAVYPVLAASFTFLFTRRHFRRSLWLFVPSAAYLLVHWHFAHPPATGPYRAYLDAHMAQTLWTYWQWALGPARIGQALIVLPSWLLLGGTMMLTLALVGFVVWKSSRKDWTAAFLLSWFLFLVTPVLPLKDQLQDYYLTTPAIPLAILGTWALVEAWEFHWAVRGAAALAAMVYLVSSLPVARAATRWNYDISRASRNLVRGLLRAHELHPGKVILLTGLSSDLFWAAIYHHVNRIAGIPEVYLAPGSEDSIQARPELADVSTWVLPPAAALRALERNRAVVYAVRGGTLRNVTLAFGDVARLRWVLPEQPGRVDVSNPLFAGHLGATWYAVDGAHRWMPERATVILRGPRSGAEKVYLAGFAPRLQLEKGPLRVSVSVDGLELGSAGIYRPDAPFELSFFLPAQLVGREKVEVAIEVDRTFVSPPDTRRLGLAFGSISIR